MVGREVYDTAHAHGDTTKNEVVLEVKTLTRETRSETFPLSSIKEKYSVLPAY
jgi:ABC-type uncharacterized transport system ATPase subunit